MIFDITDRSRENVKLKADLASIRALVVKKDEALRQCGFSIQADMPQEVGPRVRDALALTPADLADCVVVKRSEWEKLSKGGDVMHDPSLNIQPFPPGQTSPADGTTPEAGETPDLYTHLAECRKERDELKLAVDLVQPVCRQLEADLSAETAKRNALMLDLATCHTQAAAAESALVASEQARELAVADSIRLHWLHDCSNGITDAEGYEWGIYRVKWVNGKAVEVWATNSDFSDLDAEMQRELTGMPTPLPALASEQPERREGGA